MTNKQMIPIQDKINYGIGNLSVGIAMQVVGTYLVFFSTVILGIPGYLVGLAVGISVFWDAITDPLMGYASDITKSKRFGRRHLYLLIGSYGIALTILVLCIFPTHLSTNMKFKEDFDQALEQSDIIKKCSQKLNDFYNHKSLAITSGEINVRFDKIETSISMKVEPYVYDRCLTLEFTRDTIYLGNLEISYEGKIKFEPYFKNQKYFTKEISSLKFMRNTFKKHLVKCLGEII